MIKNFFDFVNEAANGQLIDTSLSPIEGGHRLNRIAADAYDEMKSAAEKDGISWNITDSYRDYEDQVKVAAKKGLYKEGGLAATPGTSNHGWGSALDLKLGSEAQSWLNKNASKFGFSSIAREPWHWEHKESAQAIKGGPSSKEPISSVLIDSSFITRLIGKLKEKGFSQEDLAKFAKTKGSKFSAGASFPVENMRAIEKALDEHGITNDYARRAILGVVSKESPNLKAETSYSNTSAERIREVFPSKFGEMSDSMIDDIKKNDDDFWDIVYGGRYGNSEPGDGSKYRGRGFNGITFKANYEKLQDLYEKSGSKLGDINIVENPELLNQPNVAAEFLVLYMLNSFKSKGKDPNSYSDLDSAVGDYVQANAGWRIPLTGSVIAKGLDQAMAFAKSLATTDGVS